MRPRDGATPCTPAGGSRTEAIRPASLYCHVKLLGHLANHVDRLFPQLSPSYRSFRWVNTGQTLMSSGPMAAGKRSKRKGDPPADRAVRRGGCRRTRGGGRITDSTG